MKLRQIHNLSGLIMTMFIGLHLFNHLYSIFGVEQHISLMNTLRYFYRNLFAEAILLSAVVLQATTGLRLFQTRRKAATNFFERLHIWTGLYLAVFLVFHLSAVMTGRYILDLDTNFYFGAAGLNTFPPNLFFIPYYGFAILSFFGHLSSVHHSKMRRPLLGISPGIQAKAILLLGFVVMLLILYGFTGGTERVVIPQEYGVIIGK